MHPFWFLHTEVWDTEILKYRRHWSLRDAKVQDTGIWKTAKKTFKHFYAWCSPQVIDRQTDRTTQQQHYAVINKTAQLTTTTVQHNVQVTQGCVVLSDDDDMTRKRSVHCQQFALVYRHVTILHQWTLEHRTSQVDTTLHLRTTINHLMTVSVAVAQQSDRRHTQNTCFLRLLMLWGKQNPCYLPITYLHHSPVI